MVIHEQRIPANDRFLSISERFCLSDGNRKTGPAAGVCFCERVCVREREKEREKGGQGTALPDPLYGFNSNNVRVTESSLPGSGHPGVYRRAAFGCSTITQIAVIILPPALDRAGVLITTTLSEPALHQIASATSLRLATLHMHERVRVIPQGARSHASL